MKMFADKERAKQPFILNLHDQEYPKIRALREDELDKVAGANEGCPPDSPVPTLTVTPDNDGGDDGCDNGCLGAMWASISFGSS